MKELRKRRIYDEEVHEVFDTFGVEVAIYFEAIRYRQQLHLDKTAEGENRFQFFPFKREDIQKRTDLSFSQQRRTRLILSTTGWIETKRQNDATCFKLTKLALECTKNTKRRRNLHVDFIPGRAYRAYA